jgi:uncharacterized OB-fold protein
MSEQRLDYFPSGKPWREHDGKFHLLGMTCRNCGTKAFPAREICSGCGRDDGLSEAELSSEGTLYTFSEVHVAPKGFATPYVIGYVDLADGVRVLGQVDGTAADLCIGQNVSMHAGTIRKKADGTDVISYRFSGSAA